MKKLHYAKAHDVVSARVVIFGADSNHASHAPSFQTASKIDRSIFSGDFARKAENQSPSLSEKMVSGEHVFDAGNIELPQGKMEQVDAMLLKFEEIFKAKQIPLCLGGDHLVKYAGLKALFQTHPDAYVIYLDAHPDCHMTDNLYYGSILHHILNESLAKPNQVILTGLRQANDIEKIGYHHYAMPTIFGMDFSLYSVNEIFNKLSALIPKGSSVYFSVDMDGFDPADTPGVEQPCPGGPKINEFIALMHLMADDYSFVGMDVTEFLPIIDTQKLTALAVIRIVKEFCAQVT